MQAEHSAEILKNDEFDSQINVKDYSDAPPLSPSGTYLSLPGPAPVPSAWPVSSHGKKQRGRKTKAVAAPLEPGPTPAPTPSGPAPTGPAANGQPLAHEPAIEDSEGFDGRRPIVDPYRVGEKITLDVSYFGVSAGEMTLEVRPFVFVNGKKSYHIAGTAISTSVFAMFYAVNDWFEAFLDYDSLVPTSYALHVKESKQLRESRCLFDMRNLRATFWDKKINIEEKVEERKYDWEIQPFSQNIFTAVYYLRNFQLRVGKKVAFRVAHEKENFDVTGEVLRKEKISTPAGELNTVVVKPQIHLNGVFHPVGDIFVWLTDDDRKYVVRIESKIKIGTIVVAVKTIEPGTAAP